MAAARGDKGNSLKVWGVGVVLRCRALEVRPLLALKAGMSEELTLQNHDIAVDQISDRTEKTAFKISPSPMVEAAS